MSSTLQAHSGVDTNKLQNEIVRGGSNLHHVTPPNEGLAGLKQAVIQEAASEGKAISQHLHHVEAPREGLSDSVKEAYLADHSKGSTSGQQRGQQNCCGKCDCGTSCKCSDKCGSNARTSDKL